MAAGSRQAAHARLTSLGLTSAAKFGRAERGARERDIGRSSAMAVTGGEGTTAESYTCARARAQVCVAPVGAAVAVRLLVCGAAAAAAGGADRGAAGAVWSGVCQSVGESCRRYSVHVAEVCDTAASR